MPIDGGLRTKMEKGMVLVAKYKGTEYTAGVDVDEDGKLVYRLSDGREFKSPSSAGSAVMDGTACNGWRFWRVAGIAGDVTSVVDQVHVKAKTTTATKTKAEPAKPERPRCEACGKHFMSAKQLEHHTANAERLCRPEGR